MPTWPISKRLAKFQEKCQPGLEFQKWKPYKVSVQTEKRER